MAAANLTHVSKSHYTVASGEAFNDVCPLCHTAKEVTFHGRYGERCPQSGCSDNTGHVHGGLQPQPRACGRGVVSFWERLRHWCWRSKPHLHYSCSWCNGVFTVGEAPPGETVWNRLTDTKDEL